ncbi:MAG: DNA-directed RNA polymerase subunit B [Candidatus Thorarchaeota archaeon]
MSSPESLSADDRWAVFETMFQELGLVRQHLHSFNQFISMGLNQIVKEMARIEPDIEGFYVQLERIEIGDPSVREADGSERAIYPMEARIRNLIYSVPLYLGLRPVYIEDGIERRDDIVKAYIGRLPLMLKSKVCPLSQLTDDELVKLGEDPRDPGGYFIINGSERVIVTQEYLVSNRVLVDHGRKGGPVQAVAKVFSTVAGFRSLVTVERRKDGRLTVNFFSVPRPLPLAILIKALGITSDRMIADLVTNQPSVIRELLPSLREVVEITDVEEALDFIGKRVAVGQTRQYRVLRAKHVLDNYLLPHLGTDETSRERKALFLAQMALRVLELTLNIREPDDKDHYANKRLKLAGEMLTSLFRVAFRSLYRDVKYQLEKGARRGKAPNLRTATRADVITERVRHALATGNWVGGKAGVSQLLDRTNYISTYSHLRRVISPLIRSQAHFEARDLHATHWGKICLAPDASVLLGDGISQIPLGNMEENYENYSVVTVDETTSKEIPSTIVAYQRISAFEFGKRVLEIKSISGRTIRATEDHPFLTDRGWVEAGDLKLSDRVLIRPTIDPSSVNDGEDRVPFTILDEETFINGTWKDKLPKETQDLIESDTKELTRIGLLPLDSDHPKLPIIARLLGAILTDGSVTNTVEFYLGRETDAVAVHRDLESLGFIANPITEKKTVFQPDKTQDPIHYQTFALTKGGAFKRLMVALGVPVGKRSEQASVFPQWILNCPRETKREFLGAFLGGDGSAPWAYKRSGRKDSYKIRLPEIEAHKHPDYVESQIKFFESLKQLFMDLGVKINTISTKEIAQTNRTAVDLIFDATKDNILRLCHNIGYRYSQEKQNKAQLIGEFLAYREEQVEQRIQDRQNVIELYNQGIAPMQIAKELNLGYRIVTSIVQRRFQQPSAIQPKSSLSAGNFFEATDADLETGMLYVPLASIKATDDDIVCDFTTALPTHNFIANGFVTHNCPNETPEGPNCGLVKNLAIQAYISVGTDEEPVHQFILEQPVVPAGLQIDHQGTKILLNGTICATTHEPERVYRALVDARRMDRLSQEMNLAWYEDERVIAINTDEGRVRRPLIICDNGIPRLTKTHLQKIRNMEWRWSDLIRNGIVEFLDAEEEENAYIALKTEVLEPQHTHLEISASAILGICASIIPYAEHNQSPRNTYEAGMTKQALGLYASNYKFRTDRRSHILQYPQIPLVSSRATEIIGFNERPAGQNVIVGVFSFQGWNIEDALVFNKASIERGMGRSHFFRSYVAEEKKYLGGQEDKFEIPQKGVRGYRASDVYRHLSESDGLIEPEIEVSGGDVLMGRTSRPRFLEEYIELERPTAQRRETSVSMRHGESGVVDTVVVTETSEGNTLVKIKVRDQRIPEVGDKFASRHGQKGIIGYICPQEDMPFTEEGIVPDILINPHAIPSRMTVGQIVEAMTAIVGSMEGTTKDATLFEAATPDEISNSLKNLGFQEYGEFVMCDGMTGEKLPARIFMGPTYYQKLHHLVADKIHARARGPIQILTRQPTEGRAREGGLRFGEMERDCLIGHGAALLLKERLLDESDKVEVLVCERCGLLASYSRKTDQATCAICGSTDTGIAKIAVSYAFKLLFQELQSLMIRPALILEDNA